jgi:hypothetical protein
MGVKMTEELRKLCLFFMKKHPFKYEDIWYVTPSNKSYLTNKEFSAVIGGNISGVQDILDRILLANALLD